MKFVIVGYGRVGSRVATILGQEGHDVVVVEHKPERAERAREEGHEAVHGDATVASDLEPAGLDEADAIGGLTGDLNVNFTACMAGKDHGCRTVLRIDEDYREEIYEKYASDVDEIVYPERLGAAGAKTALLGGDFNVLADLTERLSVASVTIPDGSPAVGKRVPEIDLPGDAKIYAHGRAREPMTIPLPQTAIEAGDHVAVMASPTTLDDVRSALRGPTAADGEA